MMHRLLIVLFGIVSTVTVAILLFLLYRYAVTQSGELPLSPRNEAPVSLKNAEPEPPSHAWLESLALKKRPAYSYAVSEMEIELPLKKKRPPEKIHRLSLENIDDYKMFCIRQLLERMNIDYSIYRQKKKAVLMIRGAHSKTLGKIVSTFGEYDIPVKIEK